MKRVSKRKVNKPSRGRRRDPLAGLTVDEFVRLEFGGDSEESIAAENRRFLGLDGGRR